MSAASQPTNTKSSRGKSVGLGVLLILVAIVAVIVGKFGLPSLPGVAGGGIGGGGTTTVSGVIGSEKRGFFEDHEVIDRLAELGLEVEFTTAGSREIAEDVDLNAHDFVFPSSEPAAEKVERLSPDYRSTYPFYSPMTVATFQPIVEVLDREGLISEQDGLKILDMTGFVELAASDARWRDLGDEFPSPRTVQIRTTDIRTSNSAAMYLSILTWVFENENPAGAEGSLVDKIMPFFAGQGYTSSSSAGPFSDYLSQGMGAAPMVMAYEAQYLGEAMKDDSRLSDDQVLLYLDPTVQAKHGVVGLTDAGKELADALASDDELQRLAATHGFRTQDPQVFAAVMEEAGLEPPGEYVATVDPPPYDQLESLITKVGAAYASPPQESEEG